MKLFKGVFFDSWARKQNISDADLVNSINEMNQGLFEANLGGNVYKKRIAIQGRGKSGGARIILAFKIKDKAFFIYGFAKNKKDNIDEKELKALKYLAKTYLSLTDNDLDKAKAEGRLIEIIK